MKLYELTAEQERFRAALETQMAMMTDEETGEFIGDDTDLAMLADIAAAEEEAANAVDEKAETIGLFSLDLDAEAAAIKAEEAKLAKRRKTLENKSKWLKAYLAKNLNGRKVSTPRMTINWRSSKSVEFDDTDAFIGWALEHDNRYLRYKTPEIDKTEVKRALEMGAVIPHAEMVVKKNMSIK